MDTSIARALTNAQQVHKRLGVALYIFLSIVLGLAASIGAVLVDDIVLIIAGLVGLTLITIVVARVEFGLQLLIFMTYTRFSDVMITEYGAPSVAKFFVVFILGVIILRWMVLKEKYNDPRLTMVVLFFFLVSCLLGLLVARDLDVLMLRVEDYLKDAIISIVIVLMVRGPSTFNRAMWALIAAAFFLGSLNSFKYLTGTMENNYWGFAKATVQHIIGETNDYRISGPLHGVNPFAHVMLPLVAICLERVLHARNTLLKFIAGWAFVASILTVIFTFSRSSFLGLVFILFLFAVRYIRKPILIVWFGLAGLLVLPFIPQDYYARMSTLLDLIPGVGETQTLTETSFRGRLSENLVGVLMYIDHPIIGVGWGNYNAWYLDYSSELGLDNRRYGRSAHNFYLEIAAEQGTVGLVTWFTLLGTMYYSMWNAIQRLNRIGEHNYADLITGLLFGLAGYSLVAFFVHDSYPRFFWLLFGMAMSTPAVARYFEVRMKQPTPTDATDSKPKTVSY